MELKQNSGKRRSRLFMLRQVTPVTSSANCKIRKGVLKIGKPPPDKIACYVHGMFKHLANL